MKSIQVLDRGSTKAIVSTQVIPNLWAALKELIENALDAQATWIDISITEYGTGTIEVQDDGCGISEELMSSFTQLNFTTKIRSFRDIHDVHTYGFRGEAVASLCHLCSELQISSRREHAAGCTVVFQEGVLVRKSATDDELGSRAHGTNIRMSGLFNTLPVRRKHFEAKAKREFSSLLLKAQEYALLVIFQSFPHLETSCINAKARIRFIHNGKVIVAPQVLGRPLDVVTSVLGPKIAKCMHEISWPFSVHASTSAPLSSHTVGNEMVYHDGLDSKAGNEETFSSEGMFFGMMGVTSARCGIQYIYLDGRPVEIPKLGKLFNATIAQDCGYLVYVCTLHLRRGERDVNMTIDKRTISLRDENEILSALQQHLIAFLSKIQHTSHQLKAMTYVPAIWTPSKSTDSKWTPNSSPGTVPSPCTEPEASGLNSQASKHKSVNTTFPIFNRNKRPREYFASQESKFSDVESDFSSQSLKSTQNSQSVDKVGHIFDTTVDSPPTTSIFDELTFSTTPRDSSSKRLNGEFNLTGRNSGSMRSASVRDDSADRVGTGCSPGIKREGSCCSPRTESTDTSSKNLEIPVNSQRTDDEHSVIYDDHEEVFESQVVYTIPVRPYQEGPTQKSISKENRELLLIRQESIHSQVGESLLTIGDFESMEVMGQFNSGFIITRFGKDLYIVDQHAADEKKNFELLMANAKEHLRPQKLIIPRVLSPAISARIDQLEMQTETLRKNGIILRVNDSLRTGASMRDVYLLATPSSMGVTYSDSEVEELIIDICDGLRAHDSGIRLAGTLRHAMATKACRKSIMIGTVLSDWHMKNIVHRLAWLEHPWNCPHGRPTIRRIASLEWGD